MCPIAWDEVDLAWDGVELLHQLRQHQLLVGDLCMTSSREASVVRTLSMLRNPMGRMVYHLPR
jgi:hypothetical protein